MQMYHMVMYMHIRIGSLLMNKSRAAIRDNTLSKKDGVTIAGKQCKSNVWAVTSNTFIDGETGMHMQVYIHLD